MNKIAALILAISATSAQAEFWSGNRLLSNMNGDHVERMMALGYVAGVFDSMVGVMFCPPSSMTLGQISDIARRELVDNPEFRHRSADVFINFPMQRLWPCKTNQPGSSL